MLRAKIDKKLVYLVLRHSFSLVAHTQIKHDVTKLSSCWISKKFLSAAELLFYLNMFLKLGLESDFVVLTFDSFSTLILIRYHCFLEVLDFEQSQIYFDFGVRWTELERVVQKVDNNKHKAVFIPIYVLIVPLLVIWEFRQDESDVFLWWNVVELHKRLLYQSQQIELLLVELEVVFF